MSDYPPFSPKKQKARVNKKAKNRKKLKEDIKDVFKRHKTVTESKKGNLLYIINKLIDVDDIRKVQKIAYIVRNYDNFLKEFKIINRLSKIFNITKEK